MGIPLRIQEDSTKYRKGTIMHSPGDVISDKYWYGHFYSKYGGECSLEKLNVEIGAELCS